MKGAHIALVSLLDRAYQIFVTKEATLSKHVPIQIMGLIFQVAKFQLQTCLQQTA
jgi:hypothetical protein